MSSIPVASGTVEEAEQRPAERASAELRPVPPRTADPADDVVRPVPHVRSRFHPGPRSIWKGAP